MKNTYLYILGGAVLGVLLTLLVGSFGPMHYRGLSRDNDTYQIPAGGMMHNDGSAMSGAMHDMMTGLSGKTGDAFDKAFLSEMIVHHQGAVDMAEAVLATSKRPELIQLAKDIIAAQTKEIGMMQGWQKAWFQ